MRPGLHTRGVMRLARIKTNKQRNNTLLFYILTFPNTDIQDFGFSKHWNSCTYSRTPLISDSGLWLFQTLELCTYSPNSHKWPLKIRKVSCRLREVVAYDSRTAGCRLRDVFGGFKLFRRCFMRRFWRRSLTKIFWRCQEIRGDFGGFLFLKTLEFFHMQSNVT